MPFLFCVSLLLSFVCESIGTERTVLAHIFKDYDNRVRPVRNETTTTVVGVQLKITSLLEVNGQQEYIRMAVFFKTVWKDEFLTWDPSEFDGTEYIRAPVSLLWLPDLTITTMSMKSDEFIVDHILGIHYTGTVDYSFPFVLTNYCPMKSDFFPFDSQECIIKVQSWKYTKAFIIMEHIYLDDTSARNPNSAFEILPYTNRTVDFSREGAAEDGSYRQVQYFVKIQRKATYYIWVLIVPTYIISSLCVAGIFAPGCNSSERQEKVTLGLTTLLTLAVILSLVTTEMPKATVLPILGLYILISIILCAVSMLVSVFIMFLHQRAITRTWPLPDWLARACFTHQHIRHRRHIYASDHANKLNNNQQIDTNEKLLNALLHVHNWLEKLDEEEKRKQLWAIVFDRMELVFLISFELLNAVSSVIVFVRDRA